MVGVPRKTDAAPSKERLKTQLDELLARGQRLDVQDPKEKITQRDRMVREWLCVRSRSGRNIPLELNVCQRRLSADYARQNIVLKARQMGITSYIAARFFVQTITRPGTLTVQVAHDQQSAEEIFRIVHRFYQNLDAEWRTGALKTSRANIRQLVFPRIDAEYRVETAADRNAGRGLTIQHLHCSEVARWPGDASETLASLRAALVPDGELVLESTPNGAAGCFYNEWQRAEENGVRRHFIPWWMEPAYSLEGVVGTPLSAEEQELREQHGLSDGQILYRRRLRKHFRGLARQEYAEDPESCFLASGECVFEREVLEARAKKCVEPVESHGNGTLQIWLPPVDGREYVIGADPAGGGAEGDYSCAEVIDRRSGLQCAELRGHFDVREFANKLDALAKRYHDALLAVERNNHGHGVLACLDNVHRYANLYCADGDAGWLMTSANRPALIENLAAIVQAQPELFQSRVFLEECRTFVRLRDGSPRAASDAHDDTVIAMAIAFMVRNTDAGKNSRNGNRAATALTSLAMG